VCQGVSDDIRHGLSHGCVATANHWRFMLEINEYLAPAENLFDIGRLK